MNNVQKIIIALTGLAVSGSAFAYIDPGTGSILLQGLLAGLAAVAVAGKVFWLRIKSFFTRKSGDKPEDQ